MSEYVWMCFGVLDSYIDDDTICKKSTELVRRGLRVNEVLTEMDVQREDADKREAELTLKQASF